MPGSDYDLLPNKVWITSEPPARGVTAVHPYDRFLNDFDRAQQIQRQRELQKLQDQVIREAERLGAARQLEQMVPSQVHANGRLRDLSPADVYRQLSQLEAPKKPAPVAAQPAQAQQPKPSLNRKLLLL